MKQPNNLARAVVAALTCCWIASVASDRQCWDDQPSEETGERTREGENESKAGTRGAA